MNIVDRLDACITNMQAICNSTRREGEEIAVHTADELAECRDAVKPLVEAAKRFCERVESGDIRSRSTYQEFKSALGELEEPDA